MVFTCWLCPGGDGRKMLSNCDWGRSCYLSIHDQLTKTDGTAQNQASLIPPSYLPPVYTLYFNCYCCSKRKWNKPQRDMISVMTYTAPVDTSCVQAISRDLTSYWQNHRGYGWMISAKPSVLFHCQGKTLPTAYLFDFYSSFKYSSEWNFPCSPGEGGLTTEYFSLAGFFSAVKPKLPLFNCIPRPSLTSMHVPISMLQHSCAHLIDT